MSQNMICSWEQVKCLPIQHKSKPPPSSRPGFETKKFKSSLLPVYCCLNEKIQKPTQAESMSGSYRPQISDFNFYYQLQPKAHNT